jgi:hypothetical protein
LHPNRIHRCVLTSLTTQHVVGGTSLSSDISGQGFRSDFAPKERKRRRESASNAEFPCKFSGFGRNATARLFHHLVRLAHSGPRQKYVRPPPHGDPTYNPQSRRAKAPLHSSR